MQTSIISALIISFFYTVETKPETSGCYSKGTLSKKEVYREDLNSEGFCPCKFGYTGPKCMDVYKCVTGELEIVSCYGYGQFANSDAVWKCFLSRKNTVAVCKCPDGFSGETCDVRTKTSISTLYTQFKTVHSFFTEEEVVDSSKVVVLERTHSVLVALTRILFFLFFASLLISIISKAFRSKKEPETNVANKVTNENVPKFPLSSKYFGGPPRYSKHQDDLLLKNYDQKRCSQSTILSTSTSESSSDSGSHEEKTSNPSIITYVENEEKNQEKIVKESVVIVKQPNLHV